MQILDELNTSIHEYNTVKLIKPNDLTVDGKTPKKAKEIARELIENANISDNPDNPIIDFNCEGAGYSLGTQTILLQTLYDKNLKLGEKEQKAIEKYKGRYYKIFNSFTRGDFKTIDNSSDLDEFTIDEMVRLIDYNR